MMTSVLRCGMMRRRFDFGTSLLAIEVRVDFDRLSNGAFNEIHHGRFYAVVFPFAITGLAVIAVDAFVQYMQSNFGIEIF